MKTRTNMLFISQYTKNAWLKEMIILFLLMVLSGFYAVHLGQDCNYDFKNYHWYNAYSFLHHRFDYDILAAGKATFNNPFLDLINYFIIQSLPKTRLIECALGALHGIAIYFLLKIALLVFKQSPYKWVYAVTAVLLGATGVASLHQVGTTYNESQVSIFVMISLFILTRAIDQDSNRTSEFMLAGLIIGMGVAAKLTAYTYALGLFASLLFFKKCNRTQLKLILITGFFSLLGFLIVQGYWMIKLYQHFQSPFFPYYNNIFHSNHIGHITALEKKYIPHSFGEAILYPFYWLKKNLVTQEFPMKDPRMAVVIVLGILVFTKQIYVRMITTKNNSAPIFSPATRFLFLFFGFSFIIWLAQFSIYRYTIPINFLSGIFIILFTLKLIDRVNHGIKIVCALLLTAIIMHHTYVPLWDRAIYRKHYIMIDIPGTPPENALVLLMNNALSYLIPYFPPSNRFVGYFNDFAKPYNTQLYNQVMSTIQSFKGPIYAIYVEEYSKPELIKEYLALSNLYITDCQPLNSNLENAKIKWCSLGHLI